MKRIALLGAALAAIGAGCWSSAPANPPAPPAKPPVMEQAAEPQTPPANPATSSTSVMEPSPAPVPATPPPTPTPPAPIVEKPAPPAPVVPPKPPEPVYVTVEMTENGFKPAQLAVKKDTIVRFKNVGGTNMWPASNPHPTHTAYQDFDARRMVKPGETYEFRFKEVGTWGCHDHLSPGLTCRIVVGE